MNNKNEFKQTIKVKKYKYQEIKVNDLRDKDSNEVMEEIGKISRQINEVFDGEIEK